MATDITAAAEAGSATATKAPSLDWDRDLEEAYRMTDERIRLLKERMTEDFWELGGALRAMQRSCLHCGSVPDAGNRQCPECGGKLGLWRATYDSFSEYLRSPAVGIPPATAYKWIRIRDFFEPRLSQIELLAPPNASEDWARRHLIEIGWSKLDIAQRLAGRSKNQDFLDILSDVRARPTQELWVEEAPDYPCKPQVEALSSLARRIKRSCRHGELGEAAAAIDELVATVGNLEAMLKESSDV